MWEATLTVLATLTTGQVCFPSESEAVVVPMFFTHATEDTHEVNVAESLVIDIFAQVAAPSGFGPWSLGSAVSNILASHFSLTVASFPSRTGDWILRASFEKNDDVCSDPASSYRRVINHEESSVRSLPPHGVGWRKAKTQRSKPTAGCTRPRTMDSDDVHRTPVFTTFFS